jgi:hypothetical protein
MLKEYCIYIKRVTCKIGEKRGKKEKKKKLDDGQLLLTVAGKKQTRPLVREGAPQRRDRKFHTELISGRESHSGLDTKTC